MIINRMSVLGMWQKCLIIPDKVEIVTRAADLLMSFKTSHYAAVETTTGVPWYLVGVIDMREESFKHTGYLGNGDPFGESTTHVPKGRGPFLSWSSGAVDALTLRGFNILPDGSHWDIVTGLMKLESYNGEGYAERGLPSPYIWSLTNQQKPGKFTSDGNFDPTVLDSQPGCASVLLTLKTKYGVDLQEQ